MTCGPMDGDQQMHQYLQEEDYKQRLQGEQLSHTVTRQDLESAQTEIQNALTQLEAQEKESKEKMDLIRLDVSDLCVHHLCLSVCMQHPRLCMFVCVCVYTASMFLCVYVSVYAQRPCLLCLCMHDVHISVYVCECVCVCAVCFWPPSSPPPPLPSHLMVPLYCAGKLPITINTFACWRWQLPTAFYQWQRWPVHALVMSSWQQITEAIAHCVFVTSVNTVLNAHRNHQAY